MRFQHWSTWFTPERPWSTARAAAALAEAQEHYGIAFHEWYVWQRYERRWGPDRDVGRKVRAGGERGGGTRGRAWVPLALERASTMWKGEPTLSAHQVARQIYLGLPDSPKSDTVRREISRLKPRTTPLGR